MKNNQGKLLVTFAIAGLAIAAVITGYTNRIPASEKGLTAWNIYQGEYGGYDVEIDEAKRDGQWFRMVRLVRKGSLIDGVVGHTSGPLSRPVNWSSVFLCGEENVGSPKTISCNEMAIGNGAPRWRPSLADQGEVFDTAALALQIRISIGKLDNAAAAVYDDRHRVQMLESY